MFLDIGKETHNIFDRKPYIRFIPEKQVVGADRYLQR
jgi:hypothetical protein